MFSSIATVLIYLFLPVSLPDPRQPVCHCFPGSPLGLYSYFSSHFLYNNILFHYIYSLCHLVTVTRSPPPLQGFFTLLWGALPAMGWHSLDTCLYYKFSLSLLQFSSFSLIITIYCFLHIYFMFKHYLITIYIILLF